MRHINVFGFSRPNFWLEKAHRLAHQLSGADATPPPVVLQGVATPVAALSAVSRVSQGCRSYPPPPQGPRRAPGCSYTRRGSFRSFEGVAGVSQLPPPPPKGPVAPHPGPLCRVSRVVWTSKALSRSRGCSCYSCGCRATLRPQVGASCLRWSFLTYG